MNYDNSWSALLKPGQSTRFFDLESRENFETEKEGYSAINAWWLAEFHPPGQVRPPAHCRQTTYGSLDPKARSPGRRGESPSAEGEGRVRARKIASVLLALILVGQNVLGQSLTPDSGADRGRPAATRKA